MSVPGRSRQILFHGLMLVLVGLVWGLFVPATPFPRLALGAHVQFVTNGMLLIVLAVLLLALPHGVGRGSTTVMLVSAWLTWPMALSEVANAWWGTRQTLPIVAEQAGASGGAPWQELIVTATHMVAGVMLIVAWALLVVGFARHRSPSSATLSSS
jgi:hydroxylaminobenzene mutase